MPKIEIFSEDVKIKTRVMPGKDGKPPRNIYEQDAYIYCEGKFPTLMKLSLEEGQPPYDAGFYTFHGSSYIVNNFGNPELKKYGKVLKALEVEL